MRKRVIAAAGTAAIIVVGGSAIAYASIPSSSGVVNGCYSNVTGDLRVVDSSASCGPQQQSLTWNQTGPQGPQGVPGPQGNAGAQGAAGPPGPAASFSTTTYVADPTTVSPGANGGNGVQCPADGIAISGGFNVIDPRMGTDSPDTATWLVLGNHVGAEVANSRSWSAGIRNTGTYDLQISVYVTCVNP